MILKTLNLTKDESTKKKTLLVPVPQFGEGAEIVVTELTVAGYIRRSNLQRQIIEMKDIDQTRRAGLLLCADLMSVMVDPETGDFLLPESQLDEFNAIVNKDTLEALLMAYAELNPARPVIHIEEKKSKS